MSYLPQFKNDLFISYRRAANETHSQWVEVFSEGLRSNLAELVGNVSIWRDNQIVGGDVWPIELQKAIDETAIFLAVVSRSYFQSTECLKEFDRFLCRMKEASDSTRRIVPVFKQPPNPMSPLPPEVTALQRHEFFHWAPPGSTTWRELGPSGRAEADADFWESLGRLSQDVMSALEEIAGIVPRGKVFVARVCPELEQQRERLRADLAQRGFLVVPRNEYLWNGAGLASELAADLQDAQFCVHLVTGVHSLDSESAAHALLQLEQAQQVMAQKGRSPPLVWIQPSETVDAGAKALIEAIEGPLAELGVEYWRGGFEDLKTQIYDKLLPPEPVAPAGGDVALIVEERDIDAIGALSAMLVDSLGLTPKLIKFDGAAPKDAERMKRTLAACPRCIVFWAAQPGEWIQDLLDLPALAAYAGRDTLCVHLAGPATAEKSVFGHPKATVVDASAGAGAGDAALRAFFGFGQH